MDLDYYSSDEEVDTSDEDIPIDESAHTPNKSIHDEYPFEVLGADKILAHMNDRINDVKTVLQLPNTVIRILLTFTNWDKEKLLEMYYGGDQDKLFRDAHIINPTKGSGRPGKKKSSRVHTSSSSSGTGGHSSQSYAASSAISASTSSSTVSTASLSLVCQICFQETDDLHMTGLECGHRFCKPCWQEYLKVKILDEGMGSQISCAAYKCDIVVDDQTVMNLVTDKHVLSRYKHIITNSFVLCNKLMRWCPSPNCNCAVLVTYPAQLPVTCRCSCIFCFECGERWHDPVKCYWLKKWIKKCEDDSETSNWIAANTKECPKCGATIEKDGGCNHMICKNQNCKADFCWVCLGPWEPHGSAWYSCNRYDEKSSKDARTAQEKSRETLQRYLFYCNRYLNHMQSIKLEHKLYERVRQKMEEMQLHNMSWIEVQFLHKAVDILKYCRQTLMYTYVFAFYLRANNQSCIFESNQKDLELATEQLSEYLERDISQDMLVDIKQKVQDKARYCEQRRGQLLDHVHEGYDKDHWEYLSYL